MFNGLIGVLGARSMVGRAVVSQLLVAHCSVRAFSRYQDPHFQHEMGISLSPVRSASIEPIPCWICVAPILVLSDYFPWLLQQGAKRIVVLSSTSRFTKGDSAEVAEQMLAQQLEEAERCLAVWATAQGVDWIVLRPTLIYGQGLDKNVAEIARFIRRFHFFPLLGEGSGLRQPIYVKDVAWACIAALKRASIKNQAFNIAGQERLSYREMLIRIFTELGQRPRLLTIPRWMFVIAVTCVRRRPRYRHWRVAMADRMDRDMVFDFDTATNAFGFMPKAFVLRQEDVVK